MDIISSPCLMVSGDFADLIRLYCLEMRFRYMALFDAKNGRTASYRIPDLPEIDCLDGDSELSRDGITITKGILQGDRVGKEAIFRLGGQRGTISSPVLNWWRAPIGVKSGVWG